MKLSIVIPAQNEEDCIERTVQDLVEVLRAESIEHEVLVVDDHSTDHTWDVLQKLQCHIPELHSLSNSRTAGYGLAVRCGLDAFVGDAVAVYMADGSDRAQDLVAYFRALEREGTDCVFGSRFVKGGETIDYPLLKLAINRCANNSIRLLFGLKYNDMTNAFKLYRKHVIDGLKPFLSYHFNLTVELPLKAIVRGYSYTVVPNQWTNRRTGVSKLKIQEMGSRYMFIVLYCFIERWLSRGDYRSLSTGRVAETQRAIGVQTEQDSP